MPLVSDRQSKPLSHSNSRAIGFWMSVEGRAPIQAVRVLVSYEALSELDPTTSGICVALWRTSIGSDRKSRSLRAANLIGTDSTHKTTRECRPSD
jgi:hypothetical protein